MNGDPQSTSQAAFRAVDRAERGSPQERLHEPPELAFLRCLMALNGRGDGD